VAIALISTQDAALAAAYKPALIIYDQDCHFSPQINRILASLPDHSDMGMHTERRAAHFAFERLHAVGVVKNWDAEWAEVRLYFREDLAALKSTLERIGLRADVRGRIAEPGTDDGTLYIEVEANDGRYFAEARSYLACGGV
jgi:hypothetical protein